MPDAGQRARLEGLFVVADGERSSTLDRLRRGATSVTATGLLGALHRLEEIRALGVGGLDLSFVPPGRLEALARYATIAKAQAVARMGEQRRTATLLAAARHLETAAGDDAPDLLDQLLGDILARADRARARERLRTLPALDLAAAILIRPPSPRSRLPLGYPWRWPRSLRCPGDQTPGPTRTGLQEDRTGPHPVRREGHHARSRTRRCGARTPSHGCGRASNPLREPGWRPRDDARAAHRRTRSPRPC